MDIASYLRNLELLVPATESAPFEWENAHPYNVVENITLTEDSGPSGFELFLAQKYADMELSFVQAQELRAGMVIVERDVRGKKTKHVVSDATRIGRYGHGHILVTISGKIHWRFEPESIIEID